LGGSASKVGDHVRTLLETYVWLPELSPRLEEKIIDYQLQVNFIISMLIRSQNERFWPDFGRFYSNGIKSLINKLKYDHDFQKQLASLFGVKTEEIRQVISTNFSKIKQERFGGGIFWQSIGIQAFYTKEEFEAEKKKQTAQ